MKKGRILLIDTFHASFSEALQAAGFTIEEGYSLSKDEIAKRINEWTGIAIRSRFKIDRNFLVNATSLKFIARGGAGMENIDLDATTEKEITCLSAPEGNRDAVGEHSIGMLLALINNLLNADLEVRDGHWNREKNRGYELQGKTVGIIGYGNMGSAFAKRLAGFDVQVLIHDKYIKASLTETYIRQCELQELYELCDVVSLHLPLTEETYHYANAAFFNAFKKPVWFLNTARGKNTDSAALAEAIQTGKVRGAALDVLEYESVSFKSLDKAHLPAPMEFILNSNKIILTPHIAGWTFESHEKIAAVLVKKILAL